MQEWAVNIGVLRGEVQTIAVHFQTLSKVYNPCSNLYSIFKAHVHTVSLLYRPCSVSTPSLQYKYKRNHTSAAPLLPMSRPYTISSVSYVLLEYHLTCLLQLGSHLYYPCPVLIPPLLPITSELFAYLCTFDINRH